MTPPRSPLEDQVKTEIGLPPDRPLTRIALTQYQLERLRKVLSDVKGRSPFYRKRFATLDPRSIQCLQDLALWPMTTDNDLRDDPLAFLCISQSLVERVVTLPPRSDREGPKRLFFSAVDLERAVDFFHFGFSNMTVPDQRMLVLMPCRKPGSVGDLLCRGLARLGVTAVPYGPPDSPEKIVETILNHRINSLVGPPSSVAALAQDPSAARIPAGQVRIIWLGTQNTRRAQAEEIGRYWGCPVYQHYGVDEMCPGGGVQCAGRDGFHLREADLIIEIIDPHTMQPVADGTNGEVAMTTLTRQAMPLVRYRTGHRAAIMAEACPCGSLLRRLTGIHNS